MVLFDITDSFVLTFSFAQGSLHAVDLPWLPVKMAPVKKIANGLQNYFQKVEG